MMHQRIDHQSHRAPLQMSLPQIEFFWRGGALRLSPILFPKRWCTVWPALQPTSTFPLYVVENTFYKQGDIQQDPKNILKSLQQLTLLFLFGGEPPSSVFAKRHAYWAPASNQRTQLNSWYSEEHHAGLNPTGSQGYWWTTDIGQHSNIQIPGARETRTVGIMRWKQRERCDGEGS